MTTIDKIAQQNIYIAPSSIHGKGVFARRNLRSNQIIGTGIRFIYGFIPKICDGLGTTINHSYQPNCYLSYEPRYSVYHIRSHRTIFCHEELTLDYRKTPWYIKGPEPHFT